MNRTRLNRIRNRARLARVPLALALAAQASLAVRASSYLDTNGVILLRTLTTNVDGAGIRVAQAEAQVNTNPPSWEVNPAAVAQPPSLFTYFSGTGASTNFPNAVGSESSHANAVGGIFYGAAAGTATNLAHVDNYEAEYFYTNIIAASPAPGIPGRVVNQSFIFDPGTNQQQTLDQQRSVDTNYDNYAARHNTLFVSGTGNGGAVNPPATGYNGIGVGAYGGASSVGPTRDNGRAKPDITAPADFTSFSTPQVAGAAVLLLQAGLRGDGGSDTNAATDARMVKALLLNGAVKPAGWTNSAASPLDFRYGAGLLNVFNAYKQLAGGKQTNFVSRRVSNGMPHPPTGSTNTVGALSGWDFEVIASDALSDAVNHYGISLPGLLGRAAFSATATLVWHRQPDQTNINDLDLFLFDGGTSNLLTASTSVVDNVEHLFLTNLPAGRYDLQVFKHGGAAVSDAETYALAFEFFTMPLDLETSGANAVLTWPVYPAGFVLQATADLSPPTAWSAVSIEPVVTNNQNRVVLDASSGIQFFRLRRP